MAHRTHPSRLRSHPRQARRRMVPGAPPRERPIPTPPRPRPPTPVNKSSKIKQLLRDSTMDTTYIDDFTRASRDELEWWKLAFLSKRHHKRMIGASDNFDLNSPASEVLITVYGLLSRLFLKGLRKKVLRGQRGAARRGTVLGKLGLGFTRRARRDSQGKVILQSNGKPSHEPAIDPDSAKVLLRLGAIPSLRHFRRLCAGVVR